MKKSLIALAVLGTLAGAASAQSSISLYGLVDAGYVNERGGPNGTVNKITSGVQNGSRIGFKGSEDLGNGLSARFLIESGFNLDTGTMGQASATAPNGLLFGRQAYVGVGSRWGEVLLGRQYTPHYTALTQIDPFGAGLAGNIINLFPAVLRMNNTIKYSAPQWNGFTGEAAYGFGEVPGNNSANRQYGASIGYNNGPLVILGAYHRADNPLGTDFDYNALIGGKWDFGIAAVSLAYQQNKGGALNAREYMGGISAPLPATAGRIMFSYLHRQDRKSLDQGANQWALGYTYAVSKRTNFYTSYGQMSNRNGGFFTVGNASDPGTGNKQFNIGIRHLF